MSLRKYQEKSAAPYPHIGELARKAMVSKGISQAELARRLKVSSTSIVQYFRQSSLQIGILWNIGIALEYDFFTELSNYYPASIPFNDQSKLVLDMNNKAAKIVDLEKEILIYKSALGIKN